MADPISEVDNKSDGEEDREGKPLLETSRDMENGKVKALRTLDEVLERVGLGAFHVILTLVSGWALASDSVEIQCISFVTPQLDLGSSANTSQRSSAGYQLWLNKDQEGVLDAIIFLGMMVGGYVWGSWSDLVGRRSCLLTSLTVNTVFGFASAFSINYPMFLVFRFFSGVGVGGSMPVAFSYFCEFFPRRNRGPFVIILAAFWIVGSVFASLLALIVIGEYGDSIHGQIGGLTIQSWRVYVILCTFPCLTASLCLLLLPESPSFLFSKKKVHKTAKTLRLVQRVNSWFGRSKRYLSVEELRREVAAACSHVISDTHQNSGILVKIGQLFRTTRDLFLPSHLRASVVMLIIWFLFSYGYYGLLLWFPEYFKYVDNCNYEKEHNCTLDPHRVNQSCSHSPFQCNRTETGEDRIYLDSLYVSLAGIPGTLLGILTVNLIGPKSMLTTSLIMSGLSTLLIWVIPDSDKTEQVVVVLSALFGGVAIIGWNALDVVSTSELFPVQLRSTAFGIQAVLGRIGAIAGNISFGRLLAAGFSPYFPILIVASALIVSGVTAIFLPSPHGEKTRRTCFRFWKFCSKTCSALAYLCCHRNRGMRLN